VSTLDELLGRLEASSRAQRQFVANASHELRTPLARQRTVIDLALGYQDASPVAAGDNQRVLAAGEHKERLIDALLTLARSAAGLAVCEPLDLASITGEVVAARGAEAEPGGLQIDASFVFAPCPGAARLLGRLIANLVDNAIRYDIPAGRVEVKTALACDARLGSCEATLTVRNTGPLIISADAERLLSPSSGSALGRRARSEGAGLGPVDRAGDRHGPRPGWRPGDNAAEACGSRSACPRGRAARSGTPAKAKPPRNPPELQSAWCQNLVHERGSHRVPRRRRLRECRAGSRD
jgi:signal transduction histidine kinase